MHEEKPAVVCLQVHKEDKQMVTWNNEMAGNLQQVLENQGAWDTTLTAYFKAIRNIQRHKSCCIKTFPQSLFGRKHSANGNQGRKTLQLVICTIVIQPLAIIFISGLFLWQSRVPHHFRTFEQYPVWLNYMRLSMKHVCDGDFWRMTMNGDSVCRRQVIWPLEGNYEIFS